MLRCLSSGLGRERREEYRSVWGMDGYYSQIPDNVTRIMLDTLSDSVMKAGGSCW
jgi:hypothetical protein